MNKKGFTLIEMLAVIVVLAVIALIAVPLITNVIEKAKQGALKDSAYGILDASEIYLAKNMKEGITDTLEFTCSNGKCVSGIEEIAYKGNIDSGKVRIYSDNKIELCITDNKNAALKRVSDKEVKVETGTCNYGELNYGVNALVSKETLDAKQKELDEVNKKYNDLVALINASNITDSDIKEGKKAFTKESLATKELETGTFRGTQVISLGSAGTYDIKTLYPDIDYTKLTADNFYVVTNGSYSNGYWNNLSFDPPDLEYIRIQTTGSGYSKSYTDGVLTVYGTRAAATAYTSVYPSGMTQVWDISFGYDVYLVY